VNGNLEFMYILPGVPGSYHDTSVLAVSSLGKSPESFVRRGFYLLADGGYVGSRWLIVPETGRGKGTGWVPSASETEMNFAISSTRMCVERAFGVLKSRFRCLARGTASWRYTKSADIVTACCVIHNICRRCSDAAPVGPSPMETSGGRPFALSAGESALLLKSRAAPAAPLAADSGGDVPWRAATAAVTETPAAFRARMVGFALQQRKSKAKVVGETLAGVEVQSGAEFSAATG